jgi:hypothetical protein
MAQATVKALQDETNRVCVSCAGQSSYPVYAPS